MIRPKGQASKRIVNTILSKYQLLEIDTTANDYFEVGERICSYIIKKSKKNGKTKLIKKDQTIDIDYNGQVIPIDKNDELKIAIFDKIESYPDTLRNLTYNDTSSSADEKTGARARMSKKKNKNQVNVYWTASSTNDHFQDKEKIKKGPKVILNRSGYYYKDQYPDKYIKLDMNEEYAIGVGAFGISVKDKAEGIRLKKLLISKLYRWYIENEKSGGFNTGINKLPLLSLDTEWTDKKLYKKFNLSDKEVKFVEDYFKSN